MRENTRCDVDDPMSTPTLRTTISSSSTSERPVLEKKTRPPTASSFIQVVPLFNVMAGLAPAIHVLVEQSARKSWMPGKRPGTTTGIGHYAPTNFGTTVPFL